MYIAIRDNIFGLDISFTGDEFHNSVREYSLPEDASTGEGSIIHVLVLSEDGEYIYAGFSNKIVCCWETKTGLIKGKYVNKKRPTALVFGRFYLDEASQTFVDFSSVHRDVLLVGDKSGEVMAVDHFMSKEPVLCGSHTTSVITDMLMHSETKLVISSDRDGDHSLCPLI